MKPATYAIAAMAKAGQFTVLGPDFVGGNGELVIAAWDTAHVAGSFELTAGGKKYVGTFDIDCPQPGNGVGTP